MKILIKDRYDVDVQIHVDYDGDLVICIDGKEICLDQYELKKVIKFANENTEAK